MNNETKEQIRDLMIQRCYEIGCLKRSQAIDLLKYSEYSFQMRSVRKRKAYLALLRYLQFDFIELSGTNKVEMINMLRNLRMLPIKKIPENSEFRFTVPEREFIDQTERKIEKRIVREEFENRRKELVYTPITRTVVEEEQFEEVEAIHPLTGGKKTYVTKDDRFPFFGFEPKKMAYDILHSPLFKEETYERPLVNRYGRKWWSNYTHPADDHEIVMPGGGIGIHDLKSISDIVVQWLIDMKFDRNQWNTITLARKLSQCFPEHNEKLYIEVLEETNVAKEVWVKFTDTRPILANVETWTPHVTKMKKVKPCQEWVDEMVELSYMPGFSILRNELMPYKRLREKFYIHSEHEDFEEIKNKKKRLREVRKSSKIHKKAIRTNSARYQSVVKSMDHWDDDLVDSKIRESMTNLLKHDFDFSSKGTERFISIARRAKFSWRFIKTFRCAMKAMAYGSNPYEILQREVYNRYHDYVKKRQKGFNRIYDDLDDY